MQAVGLLLEEVFTKARGVAREYAHKSFSSPHLLKALVSKDIGLVPILDKLEKDVGFIEEWADVRLEKFPKSGAPTSDPDPDAFVDAILREADYIRLAVNKDEVDALTMLCALVTPGVGFSFEQLRSFPLTREELMSSSYMKARDTGEKSDSGEESGTEASKRSVNRKGDSYLSKYCIDKTALASAGKIDPIIGRDKEVRGMIEVLGRRSKPNVIIIGEPGVGKTALVEGFARSIIEGKVPKHLQEAVLLEIDLGALIAGASYKGEIEDRIRGIIKEVKQLDKVILFIDEIHALMDQNRGLSGCANLLKPELARGELTLIGATTVDEYREFLEPEEAFLRRFEIIKVEEPDDESSIKILAKVAPLYEEHHGVSIDENSYQESIRLARRYLKERRLPDAAIDLMDRTMAAVRMMNETTKGELDNIQMHIERLEKSDLGEDEMKAELKWVLKELEDRVSPILLGKLDEERSRDDFETYGELLAFAQSILSRLSTLSNETKESVTVDDVTAIVAHRTGIPMGKLQSKEKERLLGMEEELQKRVIGQDHGITILSDAILESRSGLKKASLPIGSFFFLGPTGTGKTELAKALAEFLFADEGSLIRFDMSEFKEEHSAALLYGAPPGYVGYKEGGLLVNKIRHKPYSVVLFDEIEKAHPSVFDLFLQILDEGKLHDRLGKEGDFSNSVVLFTSNIGSQHIIDEFSEGRIPSSKDLLEIMGNHFRPEFLARLTEIIPFRPIQEDTVVHIFKIQLKQLITSLELKRIGFTISDEALEFLSKKGFNPKYGARPLRGVIRNELRRPISRMIVSETVKPGDTIVVGMNGEEVEINIVTN